MCTRRSEVSSLSYWYSLTFSSCSRILRRFLLVSGLGMSDPDHVQRAIHIMPGVSRVVPKDPTRRKNYAATKDDLIHLITSKWGKYEIECVYNDHIQKLTHTVAGLR